jgi:lysophospholipase L1-like esterase
MSQRKPGSGKELLVAVLLVTVSLAFTAVVLEIGLRLLGYRGAPESIVRNMMIVDDPVLDWRYIPDSRFQQGKIVNQYNSIGFRGDDHSVQKDANVKRIVVIGDSVTEGYGVGWDEVFGPQLQELLGQTYEVISLGMGGLNTPQEVHILQEYGIQYRPDDVVVNFVLNDGDFFSSAKAGAEHAEETDSKIALVGIRINPKLKRMLKSSALVFFANERLADLWGRLKGDGSHDYYAELWRDPESREKVTAAFDKLEKMSRENGFRVVVVVWPLLIDYEDYRYRSVHDWVVSEAQARGFESLDLLAVYSEHSFRNLQVTSEDHVHPNAKGHALAAQEFASWIGRTGQGPEDASTGN